MNTESEFVAHEPCNNCGSSDANSRYSDGHAYCFACHTYTPAEDWTHTHTRMNTNERAQFLGSAEQLQKRRISESTNSFYRIYRHGNTLRFPYYNASGQVVGFKIKTKSKDFHYEGQGSDQLFGQHLFPASGKRIVITEGELDAASCYEVMSGWPMVSLPHGAAAAKKDLQKAIPFLQGYQEIVLFFDNDEAGREAVESASSILPAGRVKIARLDAYKDASDALQADDKDAIRRAIWDAKPYRPDGIVDGKNLMSLVTEPTKTCDHEYPFQGLNEKLHGIRYGELTTLTAGSGSGKTSLVRAIAADLAQKGETVGILELEANNKRTALGLMSAALGKPYHIGEHDKEELEFAFADTLAKWNVFLFDGFGSFDPDVIYNRIEYLASGLECRIIFLDHLSILLSGLDGDERRMIDSTMTKLRSLVERTGIALFLVSHLRRTNSDNNSHEEGGRVSLGQLRGSHSIAQLSDSVIALERDQQGEANANLTTLRVLKNRFSGEVGVATTLSYDLSTCQFYENNETENPVFNPSTDF
jgi:twinkle protein